MKIWGMDRVRKNRSKGSSNKRLGFEWLEDKRLLAIVWANEFGTAATGNDPGLVTYGANEVYAREIVNLAIDDWNSVLTSFNYIEDNDANPNNNLDDVFQLSIIAGDLTNLTGVPAPTRRGAVLFADTTYNVDSSPTAGTIRIDDDGGGNGWFFDTTPLDDIEFTSVADTFSASFVDVDAVAQARRDDFYRTVIHEIGHVIGITSDPNAAISGMLTDLVDANNDPVYYLGLSNQNQLSRFESTRANPQFGITATFNGGHVYEGSDVYLLEGVPGVLPDPVTVFEEGNLTTPIAFETAPNDLLNSGLTVPGGVFNPENETVRQFISDLNVMILADAYGYTVTLPSDLPDFSRVDPLTQEVTDVFTSGTAQILYDSLTDTLLVQGLANDSGNTALRVNDTINVTQVGNDLRVAINYTLNDGEQREVIRDIEASRVGQILIAGNGGNDNITFDPALAELVQLIDYVVSSNVDALEAAGQNITDGIVDMSNIVPGNQTTLRAAIVETNARAGAQSIYVGRGTYNLTRTGTENGSSTNDLDITSEVAIVGAGAGLTIIDLNGLASTPAVNENRAFELGTATASLDLSRVTIANGDTTGNWAGVAIGAWNGATVNVSDSAFVNNRSSGSGVAIRMYDANVTVRRSVFTANASTNGWAAIYATDYQNRSGSLTIGESVFALNETNSSNNSWGNVWVAGGITTTPGALTNLGNNLVDDTNGGFFNNFPGVNDLIGTPDYVVTSVADRIDGTDDEYALSLRETVQQANDDGTAEIWLPAWNYRLALTGTEANNASANDLDITGDVTVVGAGAGLSVIDLSGLDAAGSQSRAFDLGTTGASLDLSRVTITSGINSSAGYSGPAIGAWNNTTLTVTDSAFVNNTQTVSNGSAIRMYDADVTILRSVFTANEATTGWGAVYATDYQGNSGTLTIGESIFALNQTASANNSWGNVWVTGGITTAPGSLTNLGNNLIDDTNGGFFNNFPGVNDQIGTPDFVVTSVVDSFRNVDDNYSLSLREAIDLANTNDNVTEEIWIPAWDFVLTRDRATFGTGTTDMNVAFGDLDISDSLTIRRAGVPLAQGVSAVQWRFGVTDAVFDLLGDFTGDGINSPDDGDVDGADFMAWMVGSSSADGDDDGDVDGDDLAVWSANFGNTLTLLNVTGV